MPLVDLPSELKFQMVHRKVPTGRSKPEGPSQRVKSFFKKKLELLLKIKQQNDYFIKLTHVCKKTGATGGIVDISSSDRTSVRGKKNNNIDGNMEN